MTMPLMKMLPLLGLRAGPLEFGEPAYLWLLLLLLPIIYLARTTRVPGTKFRHGISLAIRSVLIVAITLALADTRVVWFNRGICVVFVVDQSQSVPANAREALRGRLQSEVDKMGKDDEFVVVEFGGDAVLGSLPSLKGKLPQPVKVADAGHTDIARAIRLAVASFPADRQKRIVLLSDGNQNLEDALKEARIAGVKDIDIDTLMVTGDRGNEVMVDQLVVPPHVRKGARFAVRSIISSDAPQTGKLIVSRDGEPFATEEVQLRKGSNILDVQDVLADGGNHNYQATYIPDRKESDSIAANNTGYAFTQVDTPGRVLLVRGKSNDSNFLYNALQSVSVPVVTASPNGLPSSVQELTGYDCVILDNVNRFDIDNSPQMAALEEWVTKYGGGLVLIGGDSSFGPGGYKGTPLEKLAPVEMDVKREKHLASLALAIVNDKSGSMGMAAGGGGAASGLTKMDLANKGSTEVIRLLEESDYANIGAVDTEVKWMNERGLLPMTTPNKRSLTAETLTVRAGGGGIYCKTALYYAYELIQKQGGNAMSKHVIMFADAQDSEQQEDCVQMAAENYQRFAITTSVIGLGTSSDPHAPFQQEVAKAGHGRFFITNDAMALPKLFVKEAFLVSRKAFVEKKEGIPLTPYSSPILEGFLRGGTARFPLVYGYVGTTLKPRATLALHGESADDPVLAHWSIGLGKCVAYTCDSIPHWGKDWVSWDGYAKFWSQVVRWASRSTENNGITTTTVIEGNEGRVIVDAIDPATARPMNNQQLQASIINPDQTSTTKDLQLEQIAPGRYQGKFRADQRGTYLVAVSEAKSAGIVGSGGGVLSYPPEYRDLVPNAALLRSITECTNGSFRTSLDGVFQEKPNAVRSFWPLWQVLLVAVASALFVDVAWRRLNVADWFRRRQPAGMPVVTRGEAALGAFKAVKSGRRDVDTARKTLRERIETAATTTPVAPPVTNTIIEESPTAPTAATTEKPAETPAGEGYANRLMSAKKRAKDQIRDQERS